MTTFLHGGKSEIFFFTICAWPNWPIGAKILPRFQFEVKTDVWIIQVRRVKMSTCTKDYSCQLKVLMFDHNFIFVVDLTETFNFTHSETMHEIDHEEVFIIAKPICQQMDNRSKKQDAWNPSICNIIRWVAWTIGQTNRRPSVWFSKYYFFSWFLAKFLQKSFQFIFLFF